MADILAVLYDSVLRIDPKNPLWEDRDRLILSKGHSCVGLYAALAHTGFFPLSDLESYGDDFSKLMCHISHKVAGVEFSTGSLGHGLPFGCGRALAAKRLGKAWRTFVLLSDGELDEGSNWEAFLFAPAHRLEGLVAIVDYNKIQSLGRVDEVLPLEPLADKFRAFNWAVREIDGHDHAALAEALGSTPWKAGQPSVLIAHTVKGKGVPFMEDQLLWHYRNPGAEQLEEARKGLE